MKNIIYISMHPAPYKDAVLEKLQKEYHVKIITLYREPVTHKEWNIKAVGYDTTYLKRVALGPVGDLHFGILKRIRFGRKVVIVVSGYYPIINMIVIILSYLTRTSIVFTADSVEFCSTRNGVILFLKRMFLRGVKAFWVPGRASRDYFIKYLNVKESIIFEGSYVLDPQIEGIKINRYRRMREDIRVELGYLEDDFVFLFVGKLIPNRKIEVIIKAMEGIENGDIKLLIIGDGPCSGAVDISLNKNRNIRNIKNVEYDEIYRYYAIADAYIHCGCEPYSLALVQAVLCDLPVICTKKVGASYDYVSSNGIFVEYNDVEDLRRGMVEIYNGKIDKGMIERNREKIESRSILWAFRQLESALRIALF